MAAVLMFSGCSALKKREKKSESSVDNTVYVRGGDGQLSGETGKPEESSRTQKSVPEAGLGESIDCGSVRIKLDDVYSSDYIRTGKDTYLRPTDGNVYLFVELTLEDLDIDNAEFWCNSSLLPSVDGRMVNLVRFSHSYPDKVNKLSNFINKDLITVFPDKLQSGFIAFQAAEDFKELEIACCDHNSITGRFVFRPDFPVQDSSGQESSSGSRESSGMESGEGKETAATESFDFTLCSCREVTEDDYAYLKTCDSERYYAVSVMAKNKTDKILGFSTKDMYLRSGNESIEPVISSNYIDDILPDKYVYDTIVFGVNGDVNGGKLIYGKNREDSYAGLFDISFKSS